MLLLLHCNYIKLLLLLSCTYGLEMLFDWLAFVYYYI